MRGPFRGPQRSALQAVFASPLHAPGLFEIFRSTLLSYPKLHAVLFLAQLLHAPTQVTAPRSGKIFCASIVMKSYADITSIEEEEALCMVFRLGATKTD